jgi:hypothetical protein
VIDRAAHTPLRVGDGPYPRRLIADEAPADDEAQDGDGAVRVEIMRRVHLRYCDVFDKYLRRWIDLYFDDIAAWAPTFGARAGAVLRSPDTAFDPALWAMAALRPLPRAHLLGDDGALVAVEVAFWDGARFTALVFSGTDKEVRARALPDAVRVISVDPPGAETTPDAAMAPLGGDGFLFPDGVVVPPDPFGPAPFRLGDRAAPSF